MCSSHLRLGRGPRSRRFVSSSALRRRLRSRSDRQTGCVLSARGAGERASRQGLPPPHETRSRPRLASASARRFRSKPTSCVCCRVSSLTKPVGHDYRRPRSWGEQSPIVARRRSPNATCTDATSALVVRVRASPSPVSVSWDDHHRRCALGTGASVLIPDPALAVCLVRGLVGDVERIVRIGRTTYAAGVVRWPWASNDPWLPNGPTVPGRTGRW